MAAIPPQRILGIVLCTAICLACPAEDAHRENAALQIWPDQDLVFTAVTDESTALVIAATGEIFLTRDRGEGWQRAHVPAVEGLRSGSMFGSDSGWAVGDGVILRTEDGGSSWRRQRLPMPADQIRLDSVVAIDGHNAIAVGPDGAQLATRDGGRLWQVVSTAGAPTLGRGVEAVGLTCQEQSRGRCWSAGSVLRSTEDGGQTWRVIDIDDPARLGPIEFGVGRVEVLGTERARLEEFIAANRLHPHRTWRLEPGVSPIELEQIGQRRDPEALFELIDARLQELRSLIEEAVSSPDLVIELAEPPWDFAEYLDDDPEILERYWRAQASSQPTVAVRLVVEPKLTALRFGPERLGLAVGEHGVVIRSVDGGERWTMGEPLSSHDLLDLGIGAEQVVAVGEQGGVWLSADLGMSWSAPSTPGYAPFFDALRSVSFSPSRQWGLIVGESGRMLRSVDGGGEWESLGSAGGDESAVRGQIGTGTD